MCVNRELCTFIGNMQIRAHRGLHNNNLSLCHISLKLYRIYIYWHWGWHRIGSSGDILVRSDLRTGSVRTRMNRGSCSSWQRPQCLSMSPKKYVKRQFEACWNCLESRFLLLELLTLYLRSSQTIGSNLWVTAFIFAFLPYSSKLSEYNRIGMQFLFHLILQRGWPI